VPKEMPHGRHVDDYCHSALTIGSWNGRHCA
jgi:hypothetical protein